MRSLFVSCLCVLLAASALWVLGAPAAAADEVFELDNGVVLKGYVMREDGDELTIRLSGFTEPSTVTVERRHIRKRYPSGLPTSSTKPLAPPVFTASGKQGGGLDRSYRPPELSEETAPLPPAAAPEPRIEDEDFLSRFVRLARVAIPDSLHARLTVGGLLAVILLVLVSGGARLADIDEVPFAGTAVLAALLGAALVADVFQYEYLLRADRALYVLPAEAIGWVAAARLLLGGSIGRCVLVFGFVLISLMTVAFVTGAVFVSV